MHVAKTSGEHKKMKTGKKKLKKKKPIPHKKYEINQTKQTKITAKATAKIRTFCLHYNCQKRKHRSMLCFSVIAVTSIE